MPAGVVATLSSNSVTGSGSAVLKVTTTGATPGGSFVIAITGSGAGLSHTAYVELTLPDFNLGLTPTSIYLNQGGGASGAISITPVNGFSGKVTLASPGSLPDGGQLGVQACRYREQERTGIDG